MKAIYYDLESLDNVFTNAVFKDYENHVDVYYRIDSKEKIMHDGFEERCREAIYAANKNFNGTVSFLDLDDPANVDKMAKEFGVSDAQYANNPKAKSSYPKEYRLKCDTDPDYNEEEDPYIFGYNSDNYDLTMLALYFYDALVTGQKGFSIMPVSALSMRQYNDELFDSFKQKMPERLRYGNYDKVNNTWGKMDFRDPKAIIRKNMLMSGRHIDVSLLNEKQSKVALKRLLGTLGYQILESDKLTSEQTHINNEEELIDLIAYNISDVVNLKQLNHHKTYRSSFMLKRQLLKTYPDLKYEKCTDEYKPNISPYSVRKDRLIISSSSAQMSTKALCPYGHLSDYDTVSYMYPSARKAAELGIPRVNVLDEAKAFFYRHFDQPELRERFDAIYDYYKAIEGKNFNTSDNYLADHGIDPKDNDPVGQLPEELRPMSISGIPAPNTCLPYFKKDGTPSSCFVNFSVGGIHGAEYNLELYVADCLAYQQARKDYEDYLKLFDDVKAFFNDDPCALKAAKGVEIDGVKHTPSEFLKPKATVTHAEWKEPKAPPKEPQLFKQDTKGSYKLDPRYTFTSAGLTNHEDFTSYYPNLLRQMEAFYNEGLGYDRYGEIFDQKTEFGHKMKDKTFSDTERETYSVMRNGTKLILNSASGAGDANFESNIRMNNKIISMRIIGQLFTWRIGQAQTIEGAKVTSTNTDGLFTEFEAELNNAILERESADIHVEIEPEPTYLISKDSNNRMEIDVNGMELGDIAAVGGGTLSARKGPNPEKSLAHPAIIDWALAEYLEISAIGYKGLSLSKPFDETIGMSILKSARDAFNSDKKIDDGDLHTLLMFQNIYASSVGSVRYNFGVDKMETDDATGNMKADNVEILRHYNRGFIVDPAKLPTRHTVHLFAAEASKITDTTANKRKRDNLKSQQHDPLALEVLEANGVKASSIPKDHEARVKKINNLDPNSFVLIDNSDLHLMSPEKRAEILDALDFNAYLVVLKDTYEKNWKNEVPATEEPENKAPATLFGDGDDVAEQNNTATATETETPDAAVQTAESVNQTPEDDTPEIGEMTEAEAIDFYDLKAKNRTIHLGKTDVTDQEIADGEKLLSTAGVVQSKAHDTLKELLQLLCDTDIDADSTNA